MPPRNPFTGFESRPFRPGDPIINDVRRVRGQTTRVSPGGDHISVQMRGIEEMRNALLRFGALADDATRKANIGTAFEVMTETRTTLKAKPDDTGDLASRYHVEYQSETGSTVYFDPVSAGGTGQNEFLHVQFTNALSAIVGARSDHAAPVEFGRRAGAKPPPPGALADWLKRHGLPASMEYPLAQAIARRGIPPYPHFGPALDSKVIRHRELLIQFLREAANQTEV